MKTASLCNKRNSTNANAQKLKAQREITKKNKQNIFKAKSIKLEIPYKIDNLE